MSFVGGPYDGCVLPVQPTMPCIRLPALDDRAALFLEALLKETSPDSCRDWPHRYKLDSSDSPPVFRFVEGV